MFGDANHATDFFRNEFMMGAEHSVAIQAVHGATHTAHIGVKYTWFGSGYISNMFYKMIANKPTFRFQRGGDLRWETAAFLSSVFSCPSSSRPTLVTHSLTQFLSVLSLYWIQSLSALQTKSKPCKTDGGHEET